MANELDLNGARLEEAVFLPAAAGTTVTFKEGDMLYWVPGTSTYVQPASSFTWASSDSATRRQFRESFCGIAGESQFADSPARLVKVYTFAEVDVTCAASTAWAVGDAAGPSGAGSNTNEVETITWASAPTAGSFFISAQ